MFLCSECHSDKCKIHFTRSRGACEICGKADDCVDCSHVQKRDDATDNQGEPASVGLVAQLQALAKESYEHNDDDYHCHGKTAYEHAADIAEQYEARRQSDRATLESENKRYVAEIVNLQSLLLQNQESLVADRARWQAREKALLALVDDIERFRGFDAGVIYARLKEILADGDTAAPTPDAGGETQTGVPRTCSKCGRITVSDATDCTMTQPDGKPCGGKFR